jgi:hypothetical protein
VRVAKDGRGFVGSSGREVLAALALLTAVVWVARYWHSAHFGFYEDDYTLVTRAMASSWGEVWSFVTGLLLGFGGQGRPLQHSMVYLLSYVAGRLGGLPAAYWMGYCIVAANAILFYTLLRRLANNGFALLGAVAYCVFPADTTPAFLFHSFGLQQSLTYLLIAFHAYLSRRRVLSYLLALGSLLSYEPLFPVFLAAPLLLHPWDRKWTRRSLEHVLVLAGMLVGVFLVRRLVGEGRVSDLGIVSMIRISLMHMAFGPLATIGLFPYRALQALLGLDGETATAILLSFTLLAWVLSQIGVPPVEGVGLSVSWVKSLDVRSVFISVSARKAWATAVATRLEEGRLWIAGGVMLVLAYPLTYTLSAWESAGRATRVHMAAIVGASILFACVVSTLLQRSRAGGSRGWVRAGTAGLLALLLGFGFVAQKDYVRSWEEQRSFWAQVVRLCSDVQEGTVVLVDPSGLQDTVHMGANTWNLPRILNQLYSFPADWEEPPRVYRMQADWQQRVATEDGLFRIDASTTFAPPSLYRTVEPSQMILLEVVSGQWTRQADVLIIQGQTYQLMPPSPRLLSSYAHGRLYEWMFPGPGEGS